MRPLRIVHVLHQLALGGTEYNVLKLLRALDRTRFAPVVCSLKASVADARSLVAADIPVWELGRRGGREFGLIGLLARHLRGHRADLVHSHNWSTFLYAVAAARLAGVPAVVHGEHGLEVDNLVEPPRRLLLRQLLARGTDHFIGVSQEICDRIAGWGISSERITFIPNGVDLSRFGQPIPLEAMRSALGIAPGEPVIASVGAFRPVKDFGTLIRAFSLVHRHRPDAHLLIVGADPAHLFEPMMRELGPELGTAAGRVRQLGLRLDAPAVLSIVDVYVNSSLYEGMSNTLLEAMATRRPVVATAVGGTPDLIVDGENGYLVPPRDPAALAGRILDLLVAPALREEMGRQGRERIERRHSFERMIALNAAVYERIHDEKTRPLTTRARTRIALARASGVLGVTTAAERVASGTLMVLTYHRILPYVEKRRSASQPMIVSAEVFDRQMAQLARGYRALSLDEVLAHFRGGRRFPPRAVHVTFDDGYADNCEHALPSLVRHGIPATFFLATGPLDTGALLWWDELGQSLLLLYGRRPTGVDRILDGSPRALVSAVRTVLEGQGPAPPQIDRCVQHLNAVGERTRHLVVSGLATLAAEYRETVPPRFMLTWEEVREMHRAGMSLGGHTVGHTYLDELDEDRGQHEVRHCVERIEAETGARPRSFSYPAGRTSERSRRWFEESGIELAMTTVTGTNRCGDDRYALKRWDAAYLCIQDRFIPSQMRLELSGALRWAARFRAYRDGT